MDTRQDSHNKRGYLHKDFALFHLKDKRNLEFEFHYHEFNKIIVFLSGKVVYYIEGKAYKLKPWDILLVNNHEIHKPMIDTSEFYERMAIWINAGFLQQHNDAQCNLLTCFEQASRQKFNLLRLSPETLPEMKQLLLAVEAAGRDSDFGAGVLKNALFLQFMVLLNRSFLGIENKTVHADIEYDETICRVLDYISENLREELSLETLSTVFFISKYYLMRKFKRQTGFTIHNYILQKRLLKANGLIKEGKPLAVACAECGFGDYSNFVRAFKQMFGLSPKQYNKLLSGRNDTV
jgi:AraC-like DNA-binding protein